MTKQPRSSKMPAMNSTAPPITYGAGSSG